MYISVVMDCVTIHILNLSSVLSSNGCNFRTDFVIFLFVYPLCWGGWFMWSVSAAGFYMLFSDLVTSCYLLTPLCSTQRFLCYWTNTTGMTHLKIKKTQ